MSTCVIGTDEAGYGPNLGPLVVSATKWRIPVAADDWDPWRDLAGGVSTVATSDGRLQFGDSKQVFQAGRGPAGLAALELSVLSLLAQLQEPPRSLQELRRNLTGWRVAGPDECAAPWHAAEDVPLPVSVTPEAVLVGSERLRATLVAGGTELLGVRCDIVSERRLNSLAMQAGSKGAVLTDATLALARSLWDDNLQCTRVVCDKHGGRNRYAAAVQQHCHHGCVETCAESRDTSRYRAGPIEFWFEARAERHFPVAAASMVSKYVRELSMLAFNAFWQRQVPGLRPTQGYPQDARRYRDEISHAQTALGIPDADLWRTR